MAWDAAPTDWIASWSEDGTDVTFPLASIDQFTAAEADASTGDSRDCILRLLDHTYDWYDGLAAADKPGKLTVRRRMSQSGTSIRRTFTITIDTDVTTHETTAE